MGNLIWGTEGMRTARSPLRLSRQRPAPDSRTSPNKQCYTRIRVMGNKASYWNHLDDPNTIYIEHTSSPVIGNLFSDWIFYRLVSSVAEVPAKSGAALPNSRHCRTDFFLSFFGRYGDITPPLRHEEADVSVL